MYSQLKPVQYKRSQTSESVHNQIVLCTSDVLYHNGFQVLADHIGWFYGCPGEYNGYRPDIVATKNGLTHLIEVETLDSYKKEHCLSQLRSFSRTGFSTHVILPGDYIGEMFAVSQMKSKLLAHHMDVKVGTCYLNSRQVNFDL